MAAAAVSPLASTVEKTNGAKLSRLLVDGGTTVLRNVFDHHHPPGSLAADLHANYSTLNSLLRRRILKRHQWDKLFPPGGVSPDSNTFDITLLFLLLINISGLSPPLSGWHNKPPSSDTSHEANLARIKSYRNELYGHVTSTGIDSLAFSNLWQEISAVLVSLGLDQAEIDRLKVEHCGEEEYLDALLEWADSEEDIKSQLKEMRQSQTKTEETVGEIRQAQKEVYETLQDNTSKVEEVREAIEELQNLDKRGGMDRADEILKNLVKSEFRGDIEHHAQKFQEGTREWIFKSIENWLDDSSSQNRVMVISGNAGMGKTVISAVLSQRMQEAGRLSGSHFCQHNNARYRNPRLMVQSLACHLSHSLPQYKQALVEQLSRNLGKDLNNMEVEELFALLFKEPLSTIDDPGKNILIVIDGLDESEYQGRNELLDVIGNHFCKLPVWIRIFLTTRPERNVVAALQHLKPMQLEQNQEENLKDIQILFETQLSDKIGEEHKDVLLKELVKISEGLFLYAYFLIDFIQKNVSFLTPEQLESRLPLGISSVYLSYFKRLEKELHNAEIKVEEEHVLRFFCALTASREPLPIEFVSKILNPGGSSLTAERRVNKAITCISTLLPVRDGRLHFFHKTIKDWLTDTSCCGQHEFSVDEKQGHEIIFKLCTTELDNIKRKGVHDTQFTDTERYALQHGVQHLLEMDGLDSHSRPHTVTEELVNKYVTDLELIYAKLVACGTACLEEFFNVKRHAKVFMTDESQVAVDALFSLLRKHSYVLNNCPHLFFQCLLNDGVPELSSRAAAILETELPNVSYMKYVDNKDKQGAVLERFYCSDTVAYFDISLQMDHMVCECRDGTIHLWSLKTGTKVWARPSLVKKNFEGFFYPVGSVCRLLDWYLPYYRCVVFHPSGNFVLPGSLKHVYSLSGDSKILFSNSSCSFSDCTFTGDKRRLLTDSPSNSKEIVLWSMDSGDELNRITWTKDISSFAISQDGSLIAISDFAGAVSMFDALNCDDHRVLIKNTETVCGLMHFTSENSILVCGCVCSGFYAYGFYDKAEASFFSLKTSDESILSGHPRETQLHDFVLWPVQSCNLKETDFLKQTEPSSWFKNVRNAIPHLSVGLYLMLPDGRALIGSPTLKFVSTVNVALLNEGQEDEIPTDAVFDRILSSHKEDIIYFTVKDGSFAENALVGSFRMSTQETIRIMEITLGGTTTPWGLRQGSVPFIPTKDGVLLFTSRNFPELWNFELTECIRPLPELANIQRISPVSGDLIAFHLIKSPVTVDIMNITSGDLVTSVKTTAPCDLCVRSITCNKKQQVLLSTGEEGCDPCETVNITLTLWSNDSNIVWERCSGRYFTVNNKFKDDLMFSPQDEFVVTWNCLDRGSGVHVLDAQTGETLHRFLQHFAGISDIVDCEFVADGESLACCSEDSFLRLYNVRSGDLLSVLVTDEQPSCLGTCPGKPIVIIGLPGLKHKVIHVELPRHKDTEKKKGTLVLWLKIICNK